MDLSGDSGRCDHYEVASTRCIVLILLHWEGRRWLPAVWNTDEGSLLVTRPTGEEHATTAVRLLRDFKGAE
eukprot:416080-Rhodomonas_salina.1